MNPRRSVRSGPAPSSRPWPTLTPGPTWRASLPLLRLPAEDAPLVALVARVVALRDRDHAAVDELHSAILAAIVTDAVRGLRAVPAEVPRLLLGHVTPLPRGGGDRPRWQ